MTPDEQAGLVSILADVADNPAPTSIQSYLTVLAAGLNECWAAALLDTMKQSIAALGAPKS